MRQPQGNKKWYHTRINWGFYILAGGFALFLIVEFIVRPLVD